MKVKSINIKSKTIEQCNEFSMDFYRTLNSMFSSEKSPVQHRAEIVEAARKIEALSTEDENLLNYLEDTILRKGHKEFIVPYYLLNNDADNVINPSIQNYHFGLLGTVHDIIGDEHA
jgi:hypothetical protein